MRRRNPKKDDSRALVRHLASLPTRPPGAEPLLEEAARAAEAEGEHALAHQIRSLTQAVVPSARALSELARGHRPSQGPFVGTQLEAVETAYIGERDEGITLNFYRHADGWYWDAYAVFVPTHSSQQIQEEVGPYKNMIEAFQEGAEWAAEQLDVNLVSGWQDRLRWRMRY